MPLNLEGTRLALSHLLHIRVLTTPMTMLFHSRISVHQGVFFDADKSELFTEPGITDDD